MNKETHYIILTLLILFPILTSANNMISLISQVQVIINGLIPIVFTLALLAFFWGLAKYLFVEADDAKVQGKKIMIWGIIALFVMVSIWGIVASLQEIFGVGGVSTITIPQFSIPGGPGGVPVN
jgi:hypothetical protein